jgi:hypothetical protein
VLAKTWLARASRCPLTIHLASRGNYRSSMKPLMKVFLLYCEQWYDIHISIPQPVLESLTPAKNRLPRLQRLSLDAKLYEPLRIFECAPQLRWLKLASTLDPSMVRAPWGQLVYFDMGGCKIDHCLKLLCATSNLETCVVNLMTSEPHQSHSSVQLLRLRSMT